MQLIDYLQAGKHDTLRDQLSFIAEQAHIPEKYIRHVGAKEYCTEAEMSWLRNTKKNISEGKGGMILHGTQLHSISKKMLAIGATLTRNFIDARVYSISELLDLIESRYEDPPECTVLIIPDLCISDYEIPKRQIHKLAGYLLKRFVDEKAMIAYVDSIKVVEEKYGSNFADNLKNHYDLFSCTVEQETK